MKLKIIYYQLAVYKCLYINDDKALKTTWIVIKAWLNLIFYITINVSLVISFILSTVLSYIFKKKSLIIQQRVYINAERVFGTYTASRIGLVTVLILWYKVILLHVLVPYDYTGSSTCG